MEVNPVLSAYKDEQGKLDESLAEEVMIWRMIKLILDDTGYDIQLRLVDGLPDMELVKVA